MVKDLVKEDLVGFIGNWSIERIFGLNMQGSWSKDKLYDKEYE